MFKTILVPTDGSELADKAVHAAVEFAKSNHGKIIGLAVAEPYPYSPLAEPAFLPDPAIYDKGVLELAQMHVDKVKAVAEQAGVPCETLASLAVDPANEIVDTAARHGCDIIFMASHGRRGIQRLILGSVTQKVLAQSAVPVLVFR
jgi:nucleotide-binding universal stress UspA family protein